MEIKMNERMKEIARRVADMTDAQRAAIAAQLPIVTVEQHVISPRNACLIAHQTEQAVTIIGGFRQWLHHGRAVRKGEKALYIMRPCARGKGAADDEPQDADDSGDAAGEQSVFFKLIPVFDVTQTDELTTPTGEAV